MRYVVDTNIASAMLALREPVVRHLAKLAPEDIGLPVLVIAELLYGAERAQRKDENIARLHGLERSYPVLTVTRATAARYAQVRAALTARGRTKSDFDLVIACTALKHGAVLVTHDAALQDGSIHGLIVEDWLDE